VKGTDVNKLYQQWDQDLAKLPLTYLGQIRPLLDEKCNACHKSGGVGPFDFTKYENVVKYRNVIKNAISSGRMPPWQADNECNEYVDTISLLPRQKQVLLDWIEKGAPKGKAVTTKVPKPAALGLSREDVRLTLPNPYKPKGKPDDYRCFVMDWPGEKVQYITGFRAIPGNKAIVHHMIAFLVKPDEVKKYRALEAKESGDGYTCFGGPGGKNVYPNWLGAWAPGGQGRDFPAGTGIKIEPGSKVVLQIHYNLATAKDQRDQSSIAFKMSEQVEKEAELMPLAGFEWIDPDKKMMHIPAGKSDVRHRFAFEYTAFNDNRPLQIFSAALHMHMLGKSARIFIERGSAKKQAKGPFKEACLLHIPKWNFEWQRSYPLETSVLLYPGDKLGIECKWDNSQQNQPVVNGVKRKTRDVYWGDGTYDEMCLGLLYMVKL